MTMPGLGDAPPSPVSTTCPAVRRAHQAPQAEPVRRFEGRDAVGTAVPHGRNHARIPRMALARQRWDSSVELGNSVSMDLRHVIAHHN